METECKTLWMGDIQMHWDEAFIISLFPRPVRLKSLKKKLQMEELTTEHNAPVPDELGRWRPPYRDVGRSLDLCGRLGSRCDGRAAVSAFSSRFTTVRGAKVVMDPVTRMSKGFGFVRFGSKEEADQALQTMNGVYCSSRPMRVSVATERNKSRQQVGFGMGEEEGTNTTVFVGGLDPATTEDELRARFGALGEIVSVKVPPGRGCGFVQYTSKEAAEVAISQMNGTVISGVKVRCAWGRSAAARAANHGGNYYNQQYGQYQAGYQNYYGYNAAYGYPQYQQGGAYGYGAYGQYAQQGNQSQGGYQQQQQQQPIGSQQAHHGNYGHQQRQQHDQQRDFTRPDDIEAMNRRFASQRAYQNIPPASNASYTPMGADVANGTAMAGSM
ncbi:Nucleotide-binding alpha-beta plait domain [Phytophthora cactorum]|nr:Nucleotide-binding alpha-beta plait domain [Phytophthora cactorum]